MQQMVKLEEEMDRRPATVVWATETHTQTHTLSLLHTQAAPDSSVQPSDENPAFTTVRVTSLSKSRTLDFHSLISSSVCSSVLHTLPPSPPLLLYYTESLVLITVWQDSTTYPVRKCYFMRCSSVGRLPSSTLCVELNFLFCSLFSAI